MIRQEVLGSLLSCLIGGRVGVSGTVDRVIRRQRAQSHQAGNRDWVVAAEWVWGNTFNSSFICRLFDDLLSPFCLLTPYNFILHFKIHK